MRLYKLNDVMRWLALILAVFSVHFLGAVQAAPSGWEQVQLQKITEGCVASIVDKAVKDFQNAARRDSVAPDPAFSSDLQRRLEVKLKSSCECLTKKVAARWSTLNQMMEEQLAQVDAFVKAELQTGKCSLPYFSKI